MKRIALILCVLALPIEAQEFELLGPDFELQVPAPAADPAPPTISPEIGPPSRSMPGGWCVAGAGCDVGTMTALARWVSTLLPGDRWLAIGTVTGESTAGFAGTGEIVPRRSPRSPSIQAGIVLAARYEDLVDGNDMSAGLGLFISIP